uniref:Uncharacterized protein n=1 Tax=Mycena chlorophos TaxID=658473 RepID=A0ABQ0KX80_MYCCL|nr:predicted protein [Mycena chlorophos]
MEGAMSERIVQKALRIAEDEIDLSELLPEEMSVLHYGKEAKPLDKVKSSSTTQINPPYALSYSYRRLLFSTDPGGHPSASLTIRPLQGPFEVTSGEHIWGQLFGLAFAGSGSSTIQGCTYRVYLEG